MIGVKIDFDDSEFIKFSETLHPAAIEKAMKRAVKKTAQWVRTHVVRRVKDDGFMRKVLVGRVKVYDKNWRTGGGGGTAAKVWFGVDAVEADRIGKPVKTSKGYRVSKWDFPGAFMPKSRPGKMFQRTGKNRLPIMRSKVEIDDQGAEAFAEIEPLVPARMREIAIQELKYEMHKALGNI